MKKRRNSWGKKYAKMFQRIMSSERQWLYYEASIGIRLCV